ncbi:hypothetical protein QL285_086177 [Trifolium repens]|nr:hypothetical protein QL285_086177 [Trifolium repens]
MVNCYESNIRNIKMKINTLLFTSLWPILVTISSTSLRETFILSRYEIEIPSMDDIGVTTKSSVTIIANGPLVYPPETGDFGSIKSNGFLLNRKHDD